MKTPVQYEHDLTALREMLQASAPAEQKKAVVEQATRLEGQLALDIRSLQAQFRSRAVSRIASAVPGRDRGRTPAGSPPDASSAPASPDRASPGAANGLVQSGERRASGPRFPGSEGAGARGAGQIPNEEPRQARRRGPTATVPVATRCLRLTS